MRNLTLLRHAKSSWDDESIDDFHRPLNDRGRRSAQVLGQYLAGRGAHFDLILASPAERVVQTLDGLAKGGWDSGPVRFDRAIYHAGYRDLLAMVRSVPDNVERLMVVGHNPTIGVLAIELSRDDDKGLRAVAANNYPTGTLAEMTLDIESWGDAAPSCGGLTAFVTPRSLLEA
jgi:phosphohistidine phosphatase